MTTMNKKSACCGAEILWAFSDPLNGYVCSKCRNSCSLAENFLDSRTEKERKEDSGLKSETTCSLAEAGLTPEMQKRLDEMREKVFEIVSQSVLNQDGEKFFSNLVFSETFGDLNGKVKLDGVALVLLCEKIRKEVRPLLSLAHLAVRKEAFEESVRTVVKCPTSIREKTCLIGVGKFRHEAAEALRAKANEEKEQ